MEVLMKIPKKIHWNMMLFFMVISLLNCVSSGSITDSISLDEAIKQSAENITAEIPVKSRVAIVAFESPNTNFSDYIMEELTGALVARGIEVADRQNLEYVRNELGFQLSGEVSDDSAKSIGKFLGADFVITGQMMDIGGSYRYGVNAIHVEQAIRTSITRLTVQNDSNLRRMIAALSRQSTERSVSQYSVSETAIPDTAGTFIDRGILFATRGDFDIAIMDFSEAIKLSPNLSTAYLLRGRALYASVSRVSSIGVNFNEVNVLRHFPVVDEGRRNQLYEQAMIDFNKALELDQNNSAIYMERGRLFHLMFDDTNAIEDFTQAIRLNPNNAKAYFLRGIAYRHPAYIDGNNVYGNAADLALADFTQVIQLNPNDPEAYLERGSMYLDTGLNILNLRNLSLRSREDLALRDFTEAIRVNPNYAPAYHRRGNFYSGKNDFSRAIADYDKAIRVNSNYASAYYDRGIIHHKRGDFSKAIADYEVALRLFPTNRMDIDWVNQNLEQARKRQPYEIAEL
jgi:tetratricopeptide (TPR) repeat protein